MSRARGPDLLARRLVVFVLPTVLGACFGGAGAALSVAGDGEAAGGRLLGRVLSGGRVFTPGSGGRGRRFSGARLFQQLQVEFQCRELGFGIGHLT